MVEKFKYIIMGRQIEYERVIIIPDLKIWCAQVLKAFWSDNKYGLQNI